MRDYRYQVQETMSDYDSDTERSSRHKHNRVVKRQLTENRRSKISNKHRRVVKERLTEDEKSKTPHPVYTNLSEPGPEESLSTARDGRERTRLRRTQDREKQRAKKVLLEREKRRRTIPSGYNDSANEARRIRERVGRIKRKHFMSTTSHSTRRRVHHEENSGDDSEQGFEEIDKVVFKKRKQSSIARLSTNEYEEGRDIFKFHTTSNVGPSTMRRRYKENSDDDSDSGFEGRDKAMFRKRKRSSVARPSTKMYEEERNNFMYHSTPNVGPSVMKRRYKGDSDSDTDSDGLQIMEINDDVDAADERWSITRKNGKSDAANSAHVRGNKMCGESVNDNIVARPNAESSGMASRTRAKTKSVEKTGEVVKVPSDDTEVKGAPKDVIEVSSSNGDEPMESEKQKVPSRKENEDEMNKAPEEIEENNTILADIATSGDATQENSSPKHVSHQQQEGKEAVSEKRSVPLRKKKNKEKAPIQETHTVCTDDAPKKKRIRKKPSTSTVCTDDALKKKRIKNKSSTAQCSDQSQLAKNSNEAEEMNRLQSPSQSLLDLWTETNAGSLPLAEDKDCENEEPVATVDKDCDKEKAVVTVEKECVNEEPVEKPVKKKVSSLERINLYKELAKSVLGQGTQIESESEDESGQESTNMPLPLKFNFPDSDEEHKEKEKTESDIEIEDLFAESFAMQGILALAMAEQSSCKFPEVNSERECEHDFRQDDENGIYCIRCHYVSLGPRDILPQWAPKPRRKPGRRRSGDRDEIPESVVVERLAAAPSVKKAADFICPVDGTIWDVIPGVKEGMFKHQQEGLEYLWKHIEGSINLAEVKNIDKPDDVGGCIISHAPGTGKSRLTIAFLETYLKVFPNSRPLLIAPANMLLTWKGEFEKWGFPFPFHNLSKPGLEGNESRKVRKQFGGLEEDEVRMTKIFSWDRDGSVLAMSYNLFEMSTRDDVKGEKAESMKKILLEKPGLVIMDEGHVARNDTTNTWKSINSLKTEKRVILSGTPFQNDLYEFLNLLRLVRPAVANEIAEDKSSVETIRNSNKNKPIDVVKLENLKSRMMPYVNVHGGTTRQDLPGLTETVIHLKPQGLQERMIRTLRRYQGVTDECKVSSLSVHPYLFKFCRKPEEHPDIDMNLVEASKLNPNEGTKTKFIIELLRLSTAANEKVLIFGQYVQPFELIKDQLKEVFNWVEKKEILHIDGTLNQNTRQEYIAIFNNPVSEARVMLASTKCCSEGISLVGASRVVLLDVVWNPSVKRQAICRAYRIGQVKHVHIYHLMTSCATEINKKGRQVEKERLSELVFSSSNRESDKEKNQPSGRTEDTILEHMIGNANLADMFGEIIVNRQ